ncbi:hypothetical protein K502DRAFT_324325 [Neoconidiobolus thromboides FSU 785]|nr:hypothetical protein K502DRAFT_324325 [Neoconidiobolus thromboides FSU 785]
MYLFFNVAIAANFQLVFLHEKVITSKIELAYWFIPIIAGLIITIPPLATGLTGYGDFNGCFFVDADFTTLRVADMLVSNIWYLLTWLYLVIVVGLVVFKLRKSATQIKFSQRFTTITDSDVAQKTIKSLIHRLLLYPIVAILSTLGIMASQLNHLRVEQEDWNLEIWAMNFLALTGTFNFIAFCFDPTFQNAIYVIYCRIRYGKEGASLVSTSINKEGPTSAFDIELGKLESTTSLNQYSNDYHLL